jgi:transcriptional regulator with XRE-family HTH domain
LNVEINSININSGGGLMLSEKLKQKREEKGLNQAQLARKIGVTRDLYNKYERAGIRPSHETLVLLARELGTTVDYLISDSPDQPAAPDADGGGTKLGDIQHALYGEVRDLSDSEAQELLVIIKQVKKIQRDRGYKENA